MLSQLYICFTSEHAPVVCFAGPDLRFSVQNPRHLFAMLRRASAPLPLRKVVRVVSPSSVAAAIFVLDEHEDNIERFTAIAARMGDDLTGTPSVGAKESWIAHRPVFVYGGLKKITGAPAAYMVNRFRDLDRPPLPTPAYRLSAAFWAIGRREQALAILRNACETSTDAEDHYSLDTILGYELKRPREGLPHLQRACDLDPSLAHGFAALGHCLMLLDDAAAAVPAYERALALKPEEPLLWLDLSHACQALGDTKRCREARVRAESFGTWLPLDPDELEELAAMGKGN